MKYIAQQFEFPIGIDFTLISDATLDGERIARENEQRETERQHAEELQTTLF